ncbi:hypothetical protein RT717_15770 [Imperialibacter roseus]|uniref:Uncharacterized protein n=1 Tax=Imperialibacter roseus TaxID=1324217 RepID=A0ABZ0IJ43_9BACT|nr:hypothetical protein [Imperialibacter roseus]WOK04539.1 hypothetical protein RT717_15770 [Imperialibacter roseus]
MRAPFNEMDKYNKLIIEKPIVISNTDAIRGIVREWGGSPTNDLGVPTYNVFLTDGPTVIEKIMVNESLTSLITRQGNYAFDQNLLFKHQSFIDELEWVSIEMPDVTEAKKLLLNLRVNNFFLPEFIRPNSAFTDYSGEMTIETKRLDDIDQLESRIASDFGIKSVFVHSTNQIGEDSVSVNLWTAVNPSVGVSNNYKVSSAWKEFTDVEFNIGGCTADSVQSTIMRLGLNAIVR